MFTNGGEREGIDEIEVPVARETVAVFSDSGEVVTGLQKDNGDIGQMLAKEMENNHVLNLETAGETYIAAFRNADNFSDQLIRGQVLDFRRQVQNSSAHCTSSGQS